MKFKYIGCSEAINLNLGIKIQPGEVIEVPDSNPGLIAQFEYDRQYKKVNEVPKMDKNTSNKGDK